MKEEETVEGNQDTDLVLPQPPPEIPDPPPLGAWANRKTTVASNQDVQTIRPDTW